ncbi:MAG TPA: hypothetical protein VHL11_14905 [Phototrophicaceae bacterium]|jgi:hypothetical protein|nr:hypothetical protein [Phototrophicaceae bacterium]
MSYKPMSKYLRRFWIAAVLYTILTLASGFTVKQMAADNSLRYIVCLIPVLPMAYGLFGYLRLIREVDELQRQIHLEAVGFSLTVTAILTVIMGFLESAGAPHVSMIWVFPIIVISWGIRLRLAERRYQ